MMTEQELQAIEQRANAATPGPWTWHDIPSFDGHSPLLSFPNGYIARLFHPAGGRGVNSLAPAEPEPEANAAFIAHAREDIPALLAEVWRLQLELAFEQKPDWVKEEKDEQAKHAATIAALTPPPAPSPPSGG